MYPYALPFSDESFIDGQAPFTLLAASSIGDIAHLHMNAIRYCHGAWARSQMPGGLDVSDDDTECSYRLETDPVYLAILRLGWQLFVSHCRSNNVNVRVVAIGHVASTLLEPLLPSTSFVSMPHCAGIWRAESAVNVRDMLTTWFRTYVAALRLFDAPQRNAVQAAIRSVSFILASFVESDKAVNLKWHGSLAQRQLESRVCDAAAEANVDEESALSAMQGRNA